jgi:perosamine synthetase
MIRVFDPIVGAEETGYITDCLDTHWVSQGKYVSLFEEQFSSYIGAKHGIATSNGTTALHLAAGALGLQEGDEVLVSASTNMASALAMYYCGAKPIPIDIELDTWQMDVSLLESKITPRTKAIEVVHLFGQSVDMDPVLSLARKYKLKVIEDCAQAHGAEYKGQKVGTIGDISCFSFYANKIITSGEGGMVLTNNESLANYVRSHGNFCYGKINKFMHEGIGYNYRMPNISAALGLGQLQRIDSILAKKAEIYNRYNENLRDFSGFNIPKIRPWAKSVMWMFNVSLTSEFPISRDELMFELKNIDIETRESFVPINMQKIFLEQGFVRQDDCPNANEIMSSGLYLPSGLSLTNTQIDYICESIFKISGL